MTSYPALAKHHTAQKGTEGGEESERERGERPRKGVLVGEICDLHPITTERGDKCRVHGDGCYTVVVALLQPTEGFVASPGIQSVADAFAHVNIRLT